MKGGFSLVELVLALLLLEIGILATVGMFVLAQRNFRRAELTLRGVLEAGWAADSLSRSGVESPGSSSLGWGELVWVPSTAVAGGLRVSVWSPVEGDTLVTLLSFPPLDSPIEIWPVGVDWGDAG